MKLTGTYRKHPRTIALLGALACTGALMAGAAPASATAPSAANSLTSCYDVAVHLIKPAGNADYPVDAYLKTGSNCADINIKPDVTTNVKVCFQATGSCQSSFKHAPEGQWLAVATGVRDDSRFWFRFDSAVAIGFHAAY